MVFDSLTLSLIGFLIFTVFTILYRNVSNLSLYSSLFILIHPSSILIQSLFSLFVFLI